MKDPNAKVVYLLWLVITVLVIGGAIGGVMLARKTDALNQANLELNGNVTSLQSQLRQAKEPTPTPPPALPGTPTPVPVASSTPTPKP